MKYLIGLGNPGEKYAQTRHNVGRYYLEQFAESAGLPSWSRHKPAKALETRGMLWGESVSVLLPETFMNKSGETVAYLADKHDAKPVDFIVLHDDIDVPVGTIKVAQGKGAGGNKGLASIIQHLGSKDFVRIRIGIAPSRFWTGATYRPAGGGPLEQFVLQPFTRSEQKQIVSSYELVTRALEVLLRDGVESAMNQFNG